MADWLQQIPPHLRDAMRTAFDAISQQIPSVPTVSNQPGMSNSSALQSSCNINTTRDNRSGLSIHLFLQSTNLFDTISQVAGSQYQTNNGNHSVLLTNSPNPEQSLLSGSNIFLTQEYHEKKALTTNVGLNNSEEDSAEELPFYDRTLPLALHDPEEIRRKKIEDLIIPRNTTAVYLRLNYKHHTDPEYRKIRLVAEQALAQPPVPFHCNIRWSQIRKKATREMLIGKVQIAIGLDRDICLSIILGLIETHNRRKAKPINEQNRAANIPILRGRRVTTGKYVNRKRKNKGLSSKSTTQNTDPSAVLGNDTSQSSNSIGMLDSSNIAQTNATLESTTKSSSPSIENSDFSYKTPVMRLIPGDNHKVKGQKRFRNEMISKSELVQAKKQRLADLQAKSHQDRNDTISSHLNHEEEKAIDLVEQQWTSDIPNSQGLEYKVLVKNIGKISSFHFSWSFEEFLSKVDLDRHCNQAWYKIGKGSTNIMDSIESYTKFIEAVASNTTGHLPAIWPHTDQDWFSSEISSNEDELYYSSPCAIKNTKTKVKNKVGKAKEIATNSQAFEDSLSETQSSPLSSAPGTPYQQSDEQIENTCSISTEDNYDQSSNSSTPNVEQSLEIPAEENKTTRTDGRYYIDYAEHALVAALNIEQPAGLGVENIVQPEVIKAPRHDVTTSKRVTRSSQAQIPKTTDSPMQQPEIQPEIQPFINKLTKRKSRKF
ncbi:hypothetical protein EDC01DRAFT_634732 [Geopyxis carbonaria]|nr:hypothetical protein EDC01DRAFT_634732 [Geopyxis carbonaria]